MLAVNVFNIVMVLAIITGTGLIVFALVGYVIIEGKNEMTDRSRKEAGRYVIVGFVLAITPLLIWLGLNDLSLPSKAILSVGIGVLLFTGIVGATSSDKATVWRLGLPASLLVLGVGLVLALIDQFSN
jgi:hypothetical protein